jgi:hypothetical protein
MKTRIGYKKVFWLGLVLLLALCFGFSGASHAKTDKKADKKEILVGTNLPLTGILSMVGIEQRWAYEAAVADINKAGGVMVMNTAKSSRKPVVADDESDRESGCRRRAHQDEQGVTCPGGLPHPSESSPDASPRRNTKVLSPSICLIPPWLEQIPVVDALFS